LQTINLRRNHLQELPAEFGELRDLQYLTLSFNRLQRLPGKRYTQIRPARSVCARRAVDCSQGIADVTQMSDTFGDLTNLRMLDLHSNKLTRLPDSFIHLGRLEYLTVSYNQLNSLPRGFGDHFHNLEFLNLENNQLSSPPSNGTPTQRYLRRDCSQRGSSSLCSTYVCVCVCVCAEGLLMPMANEDDDGNMHSLVITSQSNFSSLITLRVGCNQLTIFPPGTARHDTPFTHTMHIPIAAVRCR
jgi:Leucine-rich repeat (LRR) protein